jgi:uncharacterized protein YndB with AHSA1/START domain
MNRTSMELEGDRTIVITRTFDGPPRVVFEAWTQPEHVRRWWAPKSRGVSLVGCDADVRVGGRYRYVLRHDQGGEFAFSGEYTEIVRPSRLVYTQVFEPMADAGAATITVTFEERGSKTFLASREEYPSAAVRDATIASGMEHGMREAMDQLDELVSSLR